MANSLTILLPIFGGIYFFNVVTNLTDVKILTKNKTKHSTVAITISGVCRITLVIFGPLGTIFNEIEVPAG